MTTTTTQQHKAHAAPPMGINERFTDLADKISTVLGDWKFSVISFGILGLWTIYGAVIIAHQTADWFTSQQWNFPLNTITTVGEWFIGALVAAAANRVERHNHTQVRRLDTLEQQNLRMEREHGQQLSALVVEQATLRALTEEQTAILNDQNEILALLRERIGAPEPVKPSAASGQPSGQPVVVKPSPTSQGSQPSQAPSPRPRGPMLSRDRAIRKH